MEYDIVDVHAHLGTSSTLEVGGSEDDLLRAMENNGIAQAIISPIPGYETPDGIRDTMVQNDNIAKTIERRADRFPRGLGVVEPRHGKKALPEIDRIMGDLGLAGIMFHNDYSGVYLDHPNMYAIIERAAKYKDIIIMVHTAQHSIHEAPFRLAKLAKSFPEVTFLDAHPMMDSIHIAATIELSKNHSNLLFDTCLMHHHLWPIERATREIGEDRLLFGSDIPYYTICIDKAIVEAAEISDRSKKKIFAENARRLFKLSEK